MAPADKMRTALAAQVGSAARAARLRAEWTQEEVAERAGLVTEVYGRLERGHLLPSVPTLLRLCRVLRVDANALLGFSTSHTPSWLTPLTAPRVPPAARRLLRTVLRLTPRQLEVLGFAARAMVASSRPRGSSEAKPRGT